MAIILQYPFDDMNGDRAVGSTEFALFYQNLFVNGVFINVGDALQVKASTVNSMNVVLSSGAAQINGHQMINDGDMQIAVPVASSTQARTDSIVVRLDLNNRTILPAYKQGTTQVVREDGIWELQIAQIYVGANVTGISAGNITDMRGNSEVGGYSSPFEKVPIDGLREQYEAMLQTILDEANANKDANNTAQQTALQTMNSTFQTFMTNLQNQLTDNQAANLQGQINNLAATNDAGITITHTFDGYPSVSVWSWEYGIGLVPLGEEPEGMFGGSHVKSYPVQVEYSDPSTLKIYLPDNIALTAPDILDQGDGRYLLTEGHRSVGVLIENNGYKNPQED